MKKQTITNVSAQRTEVQRVIIAANAADAALAASEQALSSLDSTLGSYAKR